MTLVKEVVSIKLGLGLTLTLTPTLIVYNNAHYYIN